jgi:transposase
MKLVEATLCQMVVGLPEPTDDLLQHMCLDKGYDYAAVRQTLMEWGYTAHIRQRGAEAQDCASVPGYRARRWVVERTHSWMNRFRRLLIRWEKKVANYIGFLHLQFAIVTLKVARVLG